MTKNVKTVRFHYSLQVAPTDVQHLAETVFKGYKVITPRPAYQALDRESNVECELSIAEEAVSRYITEKKPAHMVKAAVKYRDVNKYQQHKQWEQAQKNTKSVGVDVHVVVVPDISEINPDHNLSFDFTLNGLNMLINNKHVKALYLADAISLKATKVQTIKDPQDSPDWETINEYRKEAIIQLQMEVDYQRYSEESFTSFNSIYYDTPSTDIQIIKTTDRPYYLSDMDGNIIKDSSGRARLLGYYTNTRITHKKVMTKTDYLAFQYYLKHNLIQEQEQLLDYESVDPAKLTNISTSHSIYQVYKERKLFGLDQSPETETTYHITEEDEVEITTEDTETDSEFTSYEEFTTYSRKETKALNIADRLAAELGISLDEIAENPQLIAQIKALLNK